jgi:hypothetical protein
MSVIGEIYRRPGTGDDVDVELPFGAEHRYVHAVRISRNGLK